MTNISQIKESGNDYETHLDSFENPSEAKVVYKLEKLGRLEGEGDKELLLHLLNKNNNRIRALAIKNLAKLNNTSLLDIFSNYAHKDSSADVRREAVSAIGRLRNEKNIPMLVELLSDKDPKVVMQAIRGLLVFSKIQSVKSELKKLADHPNEMIREVINKEFNSAHREPTRLKGDKSFPRFLKNLVVQGHTEKILKYVPSQSIHLTFTSPPYYNARDYSIYQSYDEYLKFLENVFVEVHRVTKEGRFFILNTSPVIVPRISRSHSSRRYPIPYDIHHRLVGMGWEFIDDIIWVKPEASVKNRNAGFLQHRKPLAYKPNAVTEHLVVYRKKTDKLIDWNMKQYDQEETEKSKIKGSYQTTNVWHIDPAFDRVHSAVFPIELCNRIIKYYSFVGDLVFDPFAGSGTLGNSALRLGRNFFLTEAKGEYVERMKQSFTKTLDLFNFREHQIRFTQLDDFIALNGHANL